MKIQTTSRSKKEKGERGDYVGSSDMDMDDIGPSRVKGKSIKAAGMVIKGKAAGSKPSRKKQLTMKQHTRSLRTALKMKI